MRIKGIVAAAAIVCGMAVSTTTPALASGGSAGVSPQLVSVHRTAMTLQREVSAVRHGLNTTVTLDSGAKFTLPTTAYQEGNRRASTVVRPANTVFGNCGYSYTYLYDWGTRLYRLAVGFHVDSPAVGYSWSAYVNGAGSHRYSYHYTASGGLAFRSDWSGGHTGTVPGADWYDADTTYGAAQLYYGTWCFAGYTSDATYVN
jgi:hypothetical protein